MSITKKAIKINQPLGDFYVFGLDAMTLNRITYSQPATITRKLESESAVDEGYSVFGSQRAEKKNRLDEIAKFIESTEATFPNAIILAANYDDEGYLIEERSPRRWQARQIEGDLFELTIPTEQEQSASVIDGQHRLHAFTKLSDKSPHKDMELLCAVFLDLPTPYHAYVFATINFNQKKVDRGLAYELFGFDVEERTSESWPPETLAVYLARIFNTTRDSPLYKSISSPAISTESLENVEHDNKDSRVLVSMATVVDGILSLISRHPKEDRYTMRRSENINKGRAVLLDNRDLPLRTFYIKGNDKAIKEVVNNYFHAVKKVIWDRAPEHSYLLKTVGIQAQFDVLKRILQEIPINSNNYSIESLQDLFAGFDVSSGDYQASGIGRNQIKRDLLTHLRYQ